jgi:hypothetical protein
MLCGSVALGKPIVPIMPGGQDAPVYWDTTRIYGPALPNNTFRNAAAGNRFKGPADDTARIFAVMSANPKYALLLNDTTRVGPIKRDTNGWQCHGANGRYIDSSAAGLAGAAIGDVDNDGRTDMIYGRNALGGGIRYALFRAWWNGSTWQTESLSAFVGPIWDIAIGDADNDGTTDIILGAGSALFRMKWTGAWARDSIWGGDGTLVHGVAIGDFDAANPNNEIAAVTDSCSLRRIRWAGSSWDVYRIFGDGNMTFYDVAIGDFDPDNPGAEIAVNNGYSAADWGTIVTFTGSGTNWSRTQLLAWNGYWGGNGQIAVGDVFDLHSGNEIVATPGGASQGVPVMVYKSGGQWYSTLLPGAVGASYTLAIGNVDKWRTNPVPTDEMVISGSSSTAGIERRLYVYEERPMFNNDVTAQAVSFPGTYTAVRNTPFSVRTTIRNLGYNTQTAVPLSYEMPDQLTPKTWTGSLPCGAAVNYSFTAQYNPSAEGVLPVKSYTWLSTDQYRADDTVRVNVQVFASGTKVGQLFNEADWPPGWQSVLLSGDSAWGRVTTGSHPSCTPKEGAGMAWFDCYDQASGSARLIGHSFVATQPALIKLRFYMYGDNGFPSAPDKAYVEYSTDSTNWTMVDSINRYNPSNGWYQRDFDVVNLPSGQRAWIALRAVSGNGNNIFVDSLRAYTAPPTVPLDEVGVTQIVMPPSPLLVGTPYPIQVQIRNHGLSPQTLIPVSYDAGAGAVSDTWTGTLAKDSTVLFTFDPVYTPASPGSFRMWAGTVLPGDENPDNDSMSVPFQVTLPPSETGWVQMADVPAGPKGKRVKDGGALAYTEEDAGGQGSGVGDAAVGYVYAFKGYNRCEFYQYNTSANTWAAKESIPPIGTSGKKRMVKKGASLTTAEMRHVSTRLFATKGNNTLEFWQYDPETTGAYPWSQRADVPVGTKNVKEGTGLAAVRFHHPHGEDTTFVYLLKGSGTLEFYRYDILNNTWQTMASAPGGLSGKPFKNGSGIVYDDDRRQILALKGSYNEFYAYSVDLDLWTTKTALPLVGSSGKKKKVKDGAGLAFDGGIVYALKGGNTQEFWSYQVESDKWVQKPDIPLGGGKRVKGGGALTVGKGKLYALKGNNTLEFYRYGLSGKCEVRSMNYEVQSSSFIPHNSDFRLQIAPNPFSGVATITYSLPRAGNIALKLYDVTGTLVTTLASGYHNAGASSFIVHRSSLSSGIYVLKLETETRTTTSKLIIE